MSMYDGSRILRDALAIPLANEADTPYRLDIPGRKIPVSKASHVRGWHPVRTGHPAVAFESKLENRLIRLLADLPQLRHIASQPCSAYFPINGRFRRYTPDFLVELEEVPVALRRCGFARRTYVEIKPLEKAIRQCDVLRIKLRTLHRVTGIPTTLITEHDLQGLEKEVRHGA